MSELKQPPSMSIFRDTAEWLLNLEAEELGHVIAAALRYYLNGELTENLTRCETIAFGGVKSGIDRSAAKYTHDCEMKSASARKRYENKSDKE